MRKKISGEKNSTSHLYQRGYFRSYHGARESERESETETEKRETGLRRQNNFPSFSSEACLIHRYPQTYCRTSHFKYSGDPHSKRNHPDCSTISEPQTSPVFDIVLPGARYTRYNSQTVLFIMKNRFPVGRRRVIGYTICK